jgi:hypothetical protein
MGSVCVADAVKMPTTAHALERALDVARWALADVKDALCNENVHAALSRSVRVEEALANVLALVRKGVR